MRSIAYMMVTKMLGAFLPVFAFWNPWVGSLLEWLVSAHGLEWIKLVVGLWIFGCLVAYIIELSAYVPEHRWQFGMISCAFAGVAIALIQGTQGIWHWDDWRMFFTLALAFLCASIGAARTVYQLENMGKE